MPELDKDFIKTGKVKYVILDFPLEAIHPYAFKAAEAARCAGDQGKLWEMHDRLFGNQQALKLTDLPGHAKALGLDVQAFQQCLDTGKHEADVRKDLAAGRSVGVTGTPTMFFGLTNPNDPKMKPVEMIRGAAHYTGFKLAVERALAAKK